MRPGSSSFDGVRLLPKTAFIFEDTHVVFSEANMARHREFETVDTWNDGARFEEGLHRSCVGRILHIAKNSLGGVRAELAEQIDLIGLLVVGLLLLCKEVLRPLTRHRILHKFW